MTNPATPDDHDYELTRYHSRTARPYSVWVRVTSFEPAEARACDDPGSPAEIEALGWGSFEQPIELTEGDLLELVSTIEGVEPDFSDWDRYAA